MRLTMRHSNDSERAPTNHPPISKAGRPTERPQSPTLDWPHRSSSRASRTSIRSKRRYDDGLEMDKASSEITKSTVSRHIQRASSKISRKPTNKQQPSIDNAENHSNGFDKEPFHPIKDKTELSHSDESQKPKTLAVQPYPSATKTTITSHSLPGDRQDQQVMDPSPINFDVDIVPEEQNALFETSKEIPPVPPPHETLATITPEVESRSDRKIDVMALIEKQRKTINGLKDEREDLSQEIEALKQAIAVWKNRAITAASKNANVPVRTPLSRPESELLKAWQNLAYEVKNFVACHFEKVSSNKLATWAKENGEWLREITPTYQEAVIRKQSCLAMMEAAIWYSLSRLVFAGVRGHSPMRWAGEYEKALGSLGEHDLWLEELPLTQI
ncbi:hypothetical protein ACHAPJ_012071 [Fusarium lateritium]